MNLSEKSFKEQNLPAKEANFLNSMNDNHTRKTSVKFRVESEKTKSEVISSFKRKSRKSRFKVERVDEYEDGDGEQKTLENFPDVVHYLHSSDKQEQKLQVFCIFTFIISLSHQILNIIIYFKNVMELLEF